VIDENNRPIELASCYLIRDTIAVQNEFSDSVGFFTFGNISSINQIIIRYLNIEQKYPINIYSDTTLLFHFNLNKQLEEIRITNKKPLIEKQIDRIIYNVENSISILGLSAYDVIKKAPGVRVNNSFITITGKSFVLIYINEIQLKLTGDELVTYLRSIPAEDIY